MDKRPESEKEDSIYVLALSGPQSAQRMDIPVVWGGEYEVLKSYADYQYHKGHSGHVCQLTTSQFEELCELAGMSEESLRSSERIEVSKTNGECVFATDEVADDFKAWLSA